MFSWTKTKDRLPPEGATVYVTCKGYDDKFLGRYISGTWYILSHKGFKYVSPDDERLEVWQMPTMPITII